MLGARLYVLDAVLGDWVPATSVAGVGNVIINALDSVTGLPVAQTNINGAVPVRQTATEVAFPQEWYTNTVGSASASATDNVVIYTSPDIASYNYHLIENLAATDPVDIYVSLNGTDFSTVAAAVELMDNVTTGGGIKVIDIPVTKTGVLRGKFKALRVLRKGTTNEAQSIRVAHGVM